MLRLIDLLMFAIVTFKIGKVLSFLKYFVNMCKNIIANKNIYTYS